jgi:UMF1 family MFS transporter
MPKTDHWLKKALPWAMYDWANSAFATTVMAGFVPAFNKDFWSLGASETVSSFRLSVANSVAGVLVAALAPVLGAIADRASSKKKFLMVFAAMGIVMTGALRFVEAGHYIMAMTLYALATIGFSGSVSFYDSMLVHVAEEKRFDLVSALGYAMGYIGGGLLFAVNVFMVSRPEVFGLADKAAAVRWSFVMVAAWWALFTLPLLLFVPEPKNAESKAGAWDLMKDGFRQLWATFHEIRKLRVVFLFLLGYWLYIDGVDTVIRMAVDYGKALQFATEDLIKALLITQFVGFPAAIVFGKIGEKLGAKTGILIGLAAYIGVCVWGYSMNNAREFYLLAITVGLVQGGVQSLSRSLFARLIPADKAAQFFGFYNMLGKFAAIIGPLIMGFLGLITGNPRYGILGIIPLFLIGAGFLISVKVPASK